VEGLDVPVELVDAEKRLAAHVASLA
jgi:hypothetical protein